ncbi:MAG: recombination-associated protein RdgC, partial [Ectopseudomonas oleovorans]
MRALCRRTDHDPVDGPPPSSVAARRLERAQGWRHPATS